MNGPEAREPTDEGAYLRRVEETFRRLRRKPLILSPDDTALVIGWYRQGVPCRVVLEVLSEAFERAIERGAGEPRSMSYLESMVESARARAAELALGSERSVESQQERPVSRLRESYDAAAAALEGSEAPEVLRRRVAARLRRLGRGEERVSCDPIPEIEKLLCDGCLATLDETEREVLEGMAAGDIRPYVDGMPDALRERALSKALARRVRGRFRIPDLSPLPLPSRG